MKPALILFLLILGSVSLFSQPLADSVAVKQLIRNDYIALGNSDTTSHKQHCTDDYLLIENGEVWDLRKEIRYMQDKIGSTMLREDHFDFRSIKIDGSFASMVYVLRSAITKNSVTTNYQWTESAVFKKINGTWKIQLIHSTKTN